MIIIAEGFMASAILLAETAIKDNMDKKADIIIFPILFNTNHAIELYLKAIIWELNILLDNDNKIEGQHNIKQIFSVVNSRVNDFEDDKDRRKRFKEMVSNLDAYIKELFNLIENSTASRRRDNMDFSRYPFNQDYDNHFYIDELDNVVIDLENFIVRFKEIGKNLNLISNHYLYDFIEMINESDN